MEKSIFSSPEYEVLMVSYCDRSRYEVNSFSSQFVFKSIRSHFGQLVLIFRSVRTHIIFLRFIRTHLVSSYSFWSIRSHFGQFFLILELTNYEGNIERKTQKTSNYNRKEILHEKFASAHFSRI